MLELDYQKLQERYGGRFVARREGQVIASAETYDELSNQLQGAETNWVGLVIEYVEPADKVSVYRISPPSEADALRSG